MAVLCAGLRGQALAQLVPYDNFNATSRLLSPDKWGGFELGGIALESSLRIDVGKLRLSHRGYGGTAANVNFFISRFGLFLPNPNLIRAYQAEVEVVDFEATNCPANPFATEARIDFRGAFFNTGTPSPGNSTNDVNAAIFIVRRVTDPANVLQVEAEMLRCTAAACASTDSFQRKSLGSITCPGRICPLQTLFIQWEPANNLFRFRRNSTEVTISYTLADTQLPGSPYRDIYMDHLVENCTPARQRGFMEALIDNVQTD